MKIFTNNINFLFLFLISITPIIRSFGAIDGIGTQWLWLSIINFIIVIFLFFSKKDLKINLSIKIFILLFLFALLSLFYTSNISESILELSRFFIILITFINVYSLFYDSNNEIFIKKFLVFFLTSITIVELYINLSFFITYYSLGDFIGRAREYAGLAYNVNIGAFSSLLKLPFLLFLGFSSTKNTIKVFYIALSFLTIFSIFLTGSRAAFISLFLIFLLFIIYYLINKKLSSLLILGLLIFVSLSVNTFLFSKSNKELTFTSRITEISNSSSTSRIRFYKTAFSQTFIYPYIGTGIGTYKIEGLKFEKEYTEGYSVPYQVHNDFLQFGFELGVIGFFGYIIFVISIFYFLKKNYLKSSLFIPLLCSLLVFFIDSNLNFPFHRPIIIIHIAFLFSFLFLLKPSKKSLGISFIIPLVLLSFLSIVISFFSYASLVDQKYLVSSYNNKSFDILQLPRISNINDEFPNLTVTSLPIASLKAFFYLENNDLKEAKKLVLNSLDVNPFIGFNEHVMSLIFLKENKLDSAQIFAKKAFDIYPNTTHSTVLQQVYELNNDFEALDEAFKVIEKRDFVVEWENYLSIYGSVKFDYDSIVLARAKRALTLFPDSRRIKRYSNFILTSRDSLQKAYEYDLDAIDFYSNKDYLSALSLWNKAYEILPSEESYADNLCKSLLALSKFEDVIVFINNHLDKDFLNQYPKYNYYKGVSYLSLGDKQKSCVYLYKAMKSGHVASKTLYEQTCY
jgi:O-antigen ligase/tetratricopeptide (TPR) repeat protein